MNKSIAVNPVVSIETKRKVSRYFRDADHYREFRAAWKASCRENREKGHLKPEHYALYALLREREMRHGVTVASFFLGFVMDRMANLWSRTVSVQKLSFQKCKRWWMMQPIL